MEKGIELITYGTEDMIRIAVESENYELAAHLRDQYLVKVPVDPETGKNYVEGPHSPKWTVRMRVVPPPNECEDFED